MRIAPAAFAASFLASVPAVAADSYAPPQLPPPPPPPPGQTQAAPGPKAQPEAASASNATVVETGPSDGSGSALDTRWSIGAMLGASTDYLDFGLGLRGGKTLDDHIYIGGSAVYHFAGDTYAGYAGPLGSYTSSASVFYLGPEGGYDFDLKAVVLRAYLGAGAAFFAWSVNAGGTTATGSDTRFVVWPGATVIYDIPSTNFFVAGDVRFVSVPGGPAVGFFAFGGLHFGS